MVGVTAGLGESIVDAESLRIRAGGRTWTEEQTADAARILVEVEGEIGDLLGGAPISPLAVRVETAPILTDGLVCPRWPVHTVTSIDDLVVDEQHPLPTTWLLEEGYLQHTDPGSFTASTALWGASTAVDAHAYAAGTVQLGYRPGWGAVPSIRSMIMKVALARVLNSHDDTMIARDLQAEAPPPVREPTPDEIRQKLSRWRWLQVRR